MTPWNERYQAGELPWDTGRPDPHLVAAFADGTLPPGRALEIGCGTGTNAVWLAAQGCAVTAIDVSEAAIERARARAAAAGVDIDFRVVDLLAEPIPGAPFDLVFDRGCFHVFDRPEDQATFARKVAGVLAPDGRWLSLIGSTEGAPRDMGPPRRSARDIATAIEPHLAITELSLGLMDTTNQGSAPAWRCLAAARAIPAQPSTRR